MTPHYEHSDMLRATASKPCPVCRKPDWCLRREDGSAAICARIESAKRCGDAGWLHVLSDTPKVESRPVKVMTKSSVNWQEQAERYVAALANKPKCRDWLAKKLGLPVEAFDGFGLGINGITTDSVEFTIPERDGDRNIIGIATRIEREGRAVEKKCMRGSKRGLTIPDSFQVRAGPIFVVEGFTDTAAMVAAGLNAVGRPSCDGGIKHLVKLFTNVPADVKIIIVGENDAKPNGAWPGKDGMSRVAKSFAKSLARSILTALPPQDAKDVRDWLTDLVRGKQH